MERIKLSKAEKKALKRIFKYGSECIKDFPPYEIARCVRSLQDKGLAKCAFIEGGELEGVTLTNAGKSYIRNNPKLKNPTDCSKVAAIAGIIAAIASITALFVACLFYALL